MSMIKVFQTCRECVEFVKMTRRGIIKENTGPLCGVMKHQLTLEPLIEQTWPLGSSEIADFGAVRSWLILDTTLIMVGILGYFDRQNRGLR